MDGDRIALTARIGESQLQTAVAARRQLRGHVRRDERETLRQQHAEPVAAQAAHPDDVVAVHHVGPRILVGLVDQHAADAAGRHGNRQLRVDRVRVGPFLLIRELQRLAGARIVDLDVGPFAAAPRRVHELGRPDARFLSQKLDAKFFASGREDRVFGVRILREQLRDRPRRPQRAVGIRAARKRIVAAAPALRDEPRRNRDAAKDERNENATHAGKSHAAECSARSEGARGFPTSARAHERELRRARRSAAARRRAAERQRSARLKAPAPPARYSDASPFSAVSCAIPDTNSRSDRTRWQSASGYRSATSNSTGVMPAARAPTTST